MLPEKREEEVVSRNVFKRNVGPLLLPAYGEVGNWRKGFASTSDVLSRRIAPRFSCKLRNQVFCTSNVLTIASCPALLRTYRRSVF